MNTRHLTIAFVMIAPSLLAWDSHCYDYADTTLEPAAYASMTGTPCAPSDGPHTVRARWIGPLDEHRAIFERTRRLAGLPDSVSATVHLRVFTDGHSVTDGHAAVPAFTPVAFEQTRAVAMRSFSVGELAQLPDYSYALWDWATGNEQCPLDEANTDAIDCHAFSTYMGPVNANHFVPQARWFYTYEHGLALARAAECRALGERLGADGRDHGPFAHYVQACEIEALTIEAVAQHYLQDAWSVGHMWQRWGAPDLATSPGRDADERRARSLLVALAAGLIHGARGVLQAVPMEAGLDVDDALCAPNDAVRFVLDGQPVPGVGDDYLASMIAPAADTPAPMYRAQYERMMSCTSAGILAVYRASGMQHGALRTDAPFAATNIDPTGDSCWIQRATNMAMLAATGIQYRVLGVQQDTELDARLVSWALPTIGTTAGHAAIDAPLRNAFRFDLTRVVSRVRLWALTSPSGIELAEGATGDLLGLHANGAYLDSAARTSYVDPPLPWSASALDARTRDRTAALARTFHEAHVADLCALTTAATLDALRAHAQDLQLPPAARMAACEACATVLERHVRVGSTLPVCARLIAAAPMLDAPVSSTDVTAASRTLCGCR